MLGDVSALIVRPADNATPLPTVLWYHGLGTDKDLHLPELQCFTTTGFLAVGIDAVGHGDPKRIAIADASMGGCILCGAISADRRVRAPAALLGSPAWLSAPGHCTIHSLPATVRSLIVSATRSPRVRRISCTRTSGTLPSPGCAHGFAASFADNRQPRVEPPGGWGLASDCRWDWCFGAFSYSPPPPEYVLLLLS